jgi:hypothetical protein
VRWIWMGMRIQKSERLLSSRPLIAGSIDWWSGNGLLPLLPISKELAHELRMLGKPGSHQGISIKINWTWGLKPNNKKKTWNEDDLSIREFPTIWNWSPTHCHLQVRFKTGNQWLGPIITHVWTCFTAMWNNSCY